MALIEAFVAGFILYYISNFINKQIPEENQISRRVHNLNSAVSCLILIGIIYGMRCIFETLGAFNYWFLVFNNDALVFAVMTTIFYPLYKKLRGKFEKYRTEGENLFSDQFTKIFKIFIGFSWIVALIFISIPLLQIQMYDTDIFYLGFIWAALFLGIDILFTILFNKIRSLKKRLTEEVLRYPMYTSGLISYGIWSIQLIIFELYLKRLFDLELFEQDIRVAFVVLAILYTLFFYILLKKIFLPRAKEKGQLKLQNAFELAKTTSAHTHKEDENYVLLDVKDLTTYFHTEEGVVRAVEGVSFELYEGEVLGLVGETGCGKSVTALSILQVVRPPGNIEKGKIIFNGEELLQKTDTEMAKYRGKDITMIFQDPLNSLNPVFKIGQQISEVFLLHMENELLAEASKHSNKSIQIIAREWSEQLLKDLNIPFPKAIFDRYPHELSGGMRQRVQIAIALACSPKLLIADEPTTALDVTIQNQILKLMKDLRKSYNTSILFITHNLGIISKMCNRVAVMYSGSIIEYGDLKKLFKNTYHPYTRGLIASVPIVGKIQNELEVIPGMVPNLIYPPSGCRFHPRCEFCFEPCDTKVPKSIEIEPRYFVACHLYDPLYADLAKISIKKVEGKENK
ncbi:MAG: ABC transporter ATP-binding protein [Promethearchaeota archaeon]